MTIPRPSLVTSMGPSPVRGFIAAIAHPCLVVSRVWNDYSAPTRFCPLGGCPRRPPRRPQPSRYSRGVTSPDVRVTVLDGVGTLTLDRPDSLNALDKAAK